MDGQKLYTYEDYLKKYNLKSKTSIYKKLKQGLIKKCI